MELSHHSQWKFHTGYTGDKNRPPSPRDPTLWFTYDQKNNLPSEHEDGEKKTKIALIVPTALGFTDTTEPAHGDFHRSMEWSRPGFDQVKKNLPGLYRKKEAAEAESLFESYQDGAFLAPYLSWLKRVPWEKIAASVEEVERKSETGGVYGEEEELAGNDEAEIK